MLEHKCNECGTLLAESATACPKCGAVKPSQGWMEYGKNYQSLSAIIKPLNEAFLGALILAFVYLVYLYLK